MGRLSHSLTPYKPGIDERQKLCQLKLLPGVKITLPPEQGTGRRDSPPPQGVKDYIHPDFLINTLNDIPPERLEIAMLQLQHMRASRPDDFIILNNLACIYALLGRYTEAQGSFEQALQAIGQQLPAQEATDTLQQAEDILQALDDSNNTLRVLEYIQYTLQSSQAIKEIRQALQAIENVLQAIQKAKYTLSVPPTDEEASLAVDQVLQAVQEAKDVLAIIISDVIKSDGIKKVIEDNQRFITQITNTKNDQHLWGTIGDSQ